jgi:pimeloyl-ACP methyl ester carboxylesterase
LLSSSRDTDRIVSWTSRSASLVGGSRSCTQTDPGGGGSSRRSSSGVGSSGCVMPGSYPVAQTGRVPRPLAAALAALALVAAGCGRGDDPTIQVPATAPAPASAAASPTAAATRAAAAPVPKPVWKDCEGEFQCATLRVPLVDDDPSKGTVDLALTRLRTAESGRRIGSLVINPGGPGASAVEYLQAAWTLVPPPVRARFDLVAFDPRGVGRTSPVRCATTAELDSYFAVDPSPDDAAELRTIEESNEQLAAGCQQRSGRILPHVSTAEAAKDLDRVRAAVGDARLTYLGYSYGTSLGATYLDMFPTRVRAMVLDGGIDPELTWDGLLEGQSKGFDRALEAFLADCERNRCPYRKQVDGDLLAAYDRLVEQVDRTPLPTGESRGLGPGELALGVLGGLYSKASGWPAIADALVAAERGDGAPMLALSDAYLERGPEGYANVTEALSSVVCLDRQWPRELGPYTALADRVRKDAPRFGPLIALSGSICAAWPVPPVGAPKRVTAPGSPPVVVVGTTGDPATPYAWSVALADQLSKGVLVTYRGDGHTVYRTGSSACVRKVVDGYLITATGPAPATC